jgi:hypothetical protein
MGLYQTEGVGVACFDEDGSPMARDAWRVKHRDMGHKPLARDEGDEWLIEIFWVGICVESESPPKPFLVEFERVRGDGKTDRRAYWCSTRDDAFSRREKLLSKVLEPEE